MARLLFLLFALTATAQAELPRPVRVESVILAPEQTPLLLSGAIQPRIQAALAFRIGGKIIARPVETGDRVHAGQTLARLDPADLDLSFQAAQSAVQAAAADAEQARAELARYRSLNASAAYVAADYDRRLAASRIADARLAQAARQVQMAQDQRAYATLAADADGVVTALPAQLGQVVAPGQTVAELAHLAETEAVADIPESRLAALRTATSIEVEPSSTPGLAIQGRLREIGALADPATRTFQIRITLDPPPDTIALGMTVTIRILPPPGALVATLPLAALVDHDGHPAVWLLTGDHATIRPVTIAAYRDGHALIRAGLAQGDQVITAGASQLDPSMRLTAWSGPAR